MMTTYFVFSDLLFIKYVNNFELWDIQVLNKIYFYNLELKQYFDHFETQQGLQIEILLNS